MANTKFEKAVQQSFPRVQDLPEGRPPPPPIDTAFRDIDVTTITRSSGYVTQIVYSNGAKTATVDLTRTENNQITSIAMTIS